jgi:hypothetical protein
MGRSPSIQEGLQLADRDPEPQADAARDEVTALDEGVHGRPRDLEAGRHLCRLEECALGGPRHRRAKRRRSVCVRWKGMRSARSGKARRFRWMPGGATLCFAVGNRRMPLGCKWSLVQIQSSPPLKRGRTPVCAYPRRRVTPSCERRTLRGAARSRRFRVRGLPRARGLRDEPALPVAATSGRYPCDPLRRCLLASRSPMSCSMKARSSGVVAESRAARIAASSYAVSRRRAAPCRFR